MKEISLSGLHGKGLKTIVDDSDFAWLSKRLWYFDPTSGYAKQHCRRSSGKASVLKLHNLLLPPRQGMCADHINRNKLDNRRENLRYVTKGENNRNTFRRDNTSGFTGVSRTGTRLRPWVVRYSFNGKYHHVGCFVTKQEAVCARARVESDPSQLPQSGIRRWTDSDLLLLGELAISKDFELMAKKLNRTAGAVRIKAYTLGLYKPCV